MQKKKKERKKERKKKIRTKKFSQEGPSTMTNNFHHTA